MVLVMQVVKSSYIPDLYRKQNKKNMLIDKMLGVRELPEWENTVDRIFLEGRR